MVTIKQLYLMNNSTILYLKNKGRNFGRNQLIKEILKDETYFFKLNKEDAYSILEDIGIAKNKIESVYSDLISKNNYYYLQQAGKIKDIDPEIKIRYEKYDPNSLFNS